METLKFSCGNPRVETTRGAMHLFPGGDLAVGRSEQLCVPEVPGHMTCSDFCQFTGSFLQEIKEMRFVRNDAGKETYTVFMIFESQSSADSFHKYYHNKPFSSLEAEVCRVQFVAHLEYTSLAEAAASAAAAAASAASAASAVASTASSASAVSVTASALPCAFADFPTCPVCLERLDQHVSGILITVCNHSFHSSCISKWTDSSCPVCRYCQQKCENSICSVCATTDHLWMCVICGFVGCGRFREGHALKHWKETQHCYSLELETQRVWDYVGDNYVHRLIQSKADGKPVELNGPCHDDFIDGTSCECSRGTELDEAVATSKLEAVKYEYDHLLQVQMESQRQYYEGLIAEALQSREPTFNRAVEKGVSLKLEKMHERLAKAEEKKTFLEQTNKCLQDNQQAWKEKLRQLEERQKQLLKERDDKIADLQEQVRDLMVFIEAQKTIGGNAEMLEGTAIALSPETSKPKVVSRAGRRRK